MQADQPPVILLFWHVNLQNSTRVQWFSTVVVVYRRSCVRGSGGGDQEVSYKIKRDSEGGVVPLMNAFDERRFRGGGSPMKVEVHGGLKRDRERERET